jgi:hypothetical protein
MAAGRELCRWCEQEQRQRLRKFRLTAGWLGGCAIVIGAVSVLAGLLLPSFAGSSLLGLLAVAEGLLWVLSGVLTCARWRPAFYVVLVLASLKFVGHILMFVVAPIPAGIGLGISGGLITLSINALSLAGQVREDVVNRWRG